MTDEKQADNKKPEPLSFEALTAEMGDISVPVKDDDKAPVEKPTKDSSWHEMSGTVIVEDSEVPAHTVEQDLNTRVLTGSSPKPRPMWVEGLFSGILAAFFLTPVLLRTSFTQYQPWISYVVMLLALGGGLWSLLGLRQSSTLIDKRMCYISALVGFVVLVTAFLLRTSPSS